MEPRRPPNIISPHRIAGYAMEAGFSGQDAVTAVAIALKESGGDANALNQVPPDLSYGLWQINMYGLLAGDRRIRWNLASNEDLYLPHHNARAARSLFLARGNKFDDWSVYKNGSYRLVLPLAEAAVKQPQMPGVVTPKPGDGTVIELNPLEQFGQYIMNALKQPALRIAMFLGGGFLIIVAVAIYLRSTAGRAIAKSVGVKR